MNSGDMGNKLDFRDVAKGMGITGLFSISDMEQRMATVAGRFLREHPQPLRSPRVSVPMAPRAARLHQATSPTKTYRWCRWYASATNHSPNTVSGGGGVRERRRWRRRRSGPVSRNGGYIIGLCKGADLAFARVFRNASQL